MVKTFTPVTVQGVPEGSILIYTLYDFNGIPIGGTSGQAGATAYIYIPPYSTGSATVEATDGISTASNVLTIYNSDDVSSPETNYKTHLHPDVEAGQVAALKAGSRVTASDGDPVAFTTAPSPAPPPAQTGTTVKTTVANIRTKKLLKRRIKFNKYYQKSALNSKGINTNFLEMIGSIPKSYTYKSIFKTEGPAWQQPMLPIKPLLFAFALIFSFTSALNINVASRAMAKTNTPVSVKGVPAGTSIRYTLYDANGIPISSTTGTAGTTTYIYIPPSTTGSATVDADDGFSNVSSLLIIHNSDDVSSPDSKYKTQDPPEEETELNFNLRAASRVNPNGSGPAGLTKIAQVSAPVGGQLGKRMVIRRK